MTTTPSAEPSNLDIMRRLDSIAEQYKVLAEQHKVHEKRLAALEADRAIVHRLSEHVFQMSREVTVIHALLARSEESVTGALREAGRELSAQVAAAVRSEQEWMRGEVRELREAIESRPCLGGECAAGKPTEPKE